MKATKTILMIATVMFVVAPALADWDIGDDYKMHFPQLPDLVNGMNVLATAPTILADDFLCTQSGPITDIHIWGSWLFDQFPINSANGTTDPGFVDFHLSIHKDVPKDTSNPYSHPGDLLWEMDFAPGDFTDRLWTDSNERFFDPEANQIIGFDTQVIQYNFLIDPTDAFDQVEGTIYWLDVSAISIDPGAIFGWKTSADHWNDDSVYGQIPATGQTTSWNELIDPDLGFSLDQAFVITPEPATMVLLSLSGVGMLFKRHYRRRTA